MSKKTSATPIQKAVAHCGGQAPFARQLDVPAALVWQWVKGKRPVAAKHCIGIETLTDGKVSRHDLCPEVFGPAPAKQAA